jgi:hypothetical protein
MIGVLRFLTILLTAGSVLNAHAVSVSMAAKSWTIDDSQATPAGAFEEHLGRSSIHLQRGIAMLNGVSIQNGSVEADIMPSHPGSGFIGLAFRVQSTKRYELIYIRNGIGKQPNAVQYDPVFRGAITWQMHPDLQADAEIPQDRWNHLKIVFNGPHAELYIDHADKPVLVVSNLEQGDSRGSIGIWSLADGGYVSNVEYTQSPDAPYVAQPQAFAADALTEWSLSQGFRAQEVKPTDYPQLKQLIWEKVATDPPGILMIDRYRDNPDIFVPDRKLMEGDGLPIAAVVFAKTVIHSDADVQRELVFGYSDEIVMYLNGQPIFNGKNGLGYRETGAFGRLGMTESVYLPLKKGDNELVFAVKEYNGGWGFQTALK